MTTFIRSLMGPSMCEHCAVKQKYPGHAYCGKTCGAVAAIAKEATQQSVSGVRTQGDSQVGGSTSTPANSSTNQKMCLNCRSKPNFQGHDYCGKTCADYAKANPPSTTQSGGTARPSHSLAGTTPTPSRSSSGAQQMCQNCGIKQIFPGHNYCSKTCGTAAAMAKEATQRGVRRVNRFPVTRATSTPANASTDQKMCLTCRAKPRFQGHDYCGRTCADWAKANPHSTTQLAGTSESMPPPPATSTNSTTSSHSSTVLQQLCHNCRVKPKFLGHDYCGKTCADWVKSQEDAVAQTAGASGPPPNSAVAGTDSPSSSSPAVTNLPAASTLCEHCFKYVKSREMDDDGTITTHSHCGIGCYKASQHAAFSSAMVPAPAAASGIQQLSVLRTERINTPVGRKILHMVQQRWQSEILRTPQVQGIYRIELAANIYRRFDLALQMNEDCTVKTTYFGGLAACSITDDADPAPCASEHCDLCDALRSSFGGLLQGGSCRDGSYGPGLYTYSNPALAHDMMVSGDDEQAQGVTYALIQCRVVIPADDMPGSNSYAGFIDDSGVVFCAQSTAVLPTHLLIYRLSASSSLNQLKASVKSNSARTSRTVPNLPGRSGGFGQEENIALNSYRTRPKDKGKTRANAPFQTPQGQSPPSPRGSAVSVPGVQCTDPFPEALATRSSRTREAGSSPRSRAFASRGGRGSQSYRGRPASSSFDPRQASHQIAARQSSYPLTGGASEFIDAENGDEPGPSDSPIDEGDDHFDFLGQTSSRRQDY